MDDKVVIRLKKVRGQLDGVIKMYEECRECSDVVMQVAAVRAALAGVGREMLTNKAVSCVRSSDYQQMEKTLKQLFEIS